MTLFEGAWSEERFTVIVLWIRVKRKVGFVKIYSVAAEAAGEEAAPEAEAELEQDEELLTMLEELDDEDAELVLAEIGDGSEYENSIEADVGEAPDGH